MGTGLSFIDLERKKVHTNSPLCDTQLFGIEKVHLRLCSLAVRDGAVEKTFVILSPIREKNMCTYKDIDTILLPNGKTASEANSDASREIEHIYLDSWQRGVSVPFFDNAGNTYLANPDGSEDRVKLDRHTRTTAPSAIYDLIGHRLTAPRKGLNIINGRKVFIK